MTTYIIRYTDGTAEEINTSSDYSAEYFGEII